VPAAVVRLRRAAYRVLRGIALACCLLAAVAPVPAPAHEFTLDAVLNAFVKVEHNELHLVVRAPLYLFKAAKFPSSGSEIELARAEPALQRGLAALQQGVTLTEDGRALSATAATGRLSLPSDRSFDSYETATAHVAAPVEPGTRIVVDQGFIDAHLVYPIGRADAVRSVRSRVAPELGDFVRMTLRYIGPDGDARALVVRSGAGAVDLNPTRLGAATGFVGLGIGHILNGFDHLLFLLCLVIPLRGWRPLLTIVTAFTLAHSLTLIGSAFGLGPKGAWFPALVEMLIALSIVYTAIENVVGVKLPRRVLLATLFGLVHGFAFSYGLAEQLQFAGGHLLVALFAFNVGIEAGQLLALAAVLPLLVLVRHHVLTGRVGEIVLAALIAHAGWHWMAERWDALARQPWPSPDLAGLSMLIAWAGGLAVLAGLVFAVVAKLRLEPLATEGGRERAG
jgi:hypothetical protein